ncbi:conjugative transposon protein TraM [Salmonirosea aquatica]|uniref:Conjugative transposon protein TraM n=1 Tax=Salmonirosea aquatica TaxID=2654236 RepID=A0A7C9G073_9BACT|nr:conjugative transposon protein TraM [Cytophagaceae bacterium SJW1-29]
MHKVEPYHGAIIGTNGREGGNSFYGLNGQKVRNTRPSKTSRSISAVVHGDGNEITITNGSSVAIRMKEESVIGIEGEPLILPENSLVYGISRINGDRIYITVSSIRMDNYIYNVKMEAYDLDGRKGLYVPDMNLKQRTNNSVVQGSTQLASPGYIVGGSVGQQVGGQLASQGVGMALNVGKNILTKKVQQPKAQIRPNYQILLRSGTVTSEINLNEDEVYDENKTN